MGGRGGGEVGEEEQEGEEEGEEEEEEEEEEETPDFVESHGEVGGRTNIEIGRVPSSPGR